MLNTKWFQPELDRANQNQDRQIYPVIGPGLEPGTSDLTLQVKDQLPLHGHMEINDKSTPGTPLLRLDTALQYNNLWQHDHQIGFDYNFSPQEMKPGNAPQFYDQPMVASYSGFYRMPLGCGKDCGENYRQSAGGFRLRRSHPQFNLPPPTGNPDLIVYASRSTSDTPDDLWPASNPFSRTRWPTINSQPSNADPTDNYRERRHQTDFSAPRISGRSARRCSFGFDYKYYEAQTYSTNVTTLRPLFD